MPGIDDFSKSVNSSVNYLNDGASKIAKNVKNYVDGSQKEANSTKEAKNRMALFPAAPFLATKGEKFRLGKQIANGVFAATLGLMMAPGYALTASYINSLVKNQEKLEEKLKDLKRNIEVQGSEAVNADTDAMRTGRNIDIDQSELLNSETYKNFEKIGEVESKMKAGKARLNKINNLGKKINLGRLNIPTISKNDAFTTEDKDPDKKIKLE